MKQHNGVNTIQRLYFPDSTVLTLTLAQDVLAYLCTVGGRGDASSIFFNISGCDKC